MQTALIDDSLDDRVAVRDDALPPARLRVITASALACGVVADLFFDAGPGGIGLALYLLAVCASLSSAVRFPTWRWVHDTVPPHTRLLLGLAATFALLVAIRDSEVLAVFNTLAALSAIGLAAMVWPGSGLNLFALRVRDLVFAAAACARDAILGTPLFLHRDGRHVLHSSRASGAGLPVAGALGRALLLGTIVTLFFGLLLSAGDPVFRHLVSPLVSWELSPIGEHLLTVGFFAWPVLGLLWMAGRRAALTSRGKVAPPGAVAVVVEGLMERVQPVLNRLDVLVALGAMNALFALFLLLQVRVLFGGQAYVMATTGLTMAEYARGGFFALTFAAAMVVGLLLLVDTLMGGGRLGEWRVSRRLSNALLAFVGVVLFSATTRMLLYVSTFGISVDRVVALAIMAWVAMVSLWFSLTVLRGRPARFVAGAMCAGGVTLLALNAINIDAIVVRSGLSRVAAGRPLDVEYMTAGLSADGVPALVDAVVRGRLDGAVIEPRANAVRSTQPSVQPSVVRPAPSPPVISQRIGAACTTAGLLLVRWGPATMDRPAHRTFGSWRARRAVSRNRRALEAAACPGTTASGQCATPAICAPPR